MYGLLPDHAILAAAKSDQITIDPFDMCRIQPCSYDLTLGSTFEYLTAGTEIDPAREVPTHRAIASTIRLRPGGFVLAGTRERITLDASHACRVEGKSSLGRLGLAVHVTAGWIDPGFSGQVTLELVNHASRPIVLHAGMLIAQACFWRLASPVADMYGQPSVSSRYQGQDAPTASRSWVGFTSDAHR